LNIDSCVCASLYFSLLSSLLYSFLYPIIFFSLERQRDCFENNLNVARSLESSLTFLYVPGTARNLLRWRKSQRSTYRSVYHRFN